MRRIILLATASGMAFWELRELPLRDFPLSGFPLSGFSLAGPELGWLVLAPMP
jgi:hypothetical protein